MARGDKKNGVDGWKVIGTDALGRPIFGKDIKPLDKKRYKDTAKRALDPMADVRTKVDKKRLDSLPVEFVSVFFGEGGSWNDISEDGNTIYGTYDATGSDVVMSRHGEEIIIAVDGEIASVIGPPEERELKMQHVEYELQGEEIDRKHINDVDISTDEKTGSRIVKMSTTNGSTLTYRISPDGVHATGYITAADEYGKVETREIAQNIPVEDIVELSNTIAEQEGKSGSIIAKAGEAVVIGKYFKREWKKYSNRPRAEYPNLPFTGAITKFFEKALRPFDGF